MIFRIIVLRLGVKRPLLLYLSAYILVVATYYRISTRHIHSKFMLLNHWENIVKR